MTLDPLATTLRSMVDAVGALAPAPKETGVESNSPVIVIVEVVAKPGCFEPVLAAFRQSRARARNWVGCQGFEITTPEGRENTLIIVERWDSAADHARILAEITASEGFHNFRKLLAKDLSSQRLVIVPADT